MRSAYHAGELAVQQRAGVHVLARKIGGSIHDSIPPGAGAFLEQRRFLVLSTIDAESRPWASILSGRPGFARAIDPTTVRIEASPLPGDPLGDNIAVSGFAGLIALDQATRRRLRVNGRLERSPDGAFLIQADQVYSNCPKYIQKRSEDEALATRAPRLLARSASLTEAEREWIRRADTFFIATANPNAGADASHRGGMPGFVVVEGDRLTWPDYAGNSMFNTLGNIAVHPWAGLLFPDFETGSLLQLSGRAEIDWEAAHAAQIPGAERLVHLEVTEVVKIAAAVPLMRLSDYSPFNPRADQRIAG